MSRAPLLLLFDIDGTLLLGAHREHRDAVHEALREVYGIPDPAAAIVVDVTHATDAPGIDAKELGKHELGSGPVLGRGATINPRVFELLHDTAEAEGIPFTVEASGRGTGTDADAIHLSRSGWRCCRRTSRAMP